MEVPQEVISIWSCKDQQIMVKGKRTKRRRPQSLDNYTNSDSFPATSAEVYRDRTAKEEEDMANCLILLARGPTEKLDEDAKFTSRRNLQAATRTEGSKAGYYVYECKTCGRSFPSFQALGGHRASHKKPKNMAAEERRQLMLLSFDDDEDTQSHMPSLSLQLSNRSLYNTTTKKNYTKKSCKSHECSICGAEFSSGQALGGHMRRHRGSLSTTASAAMSLTPMASDSEELPVPKKPRNVLSLDLDLNLPAPVDDHRHEGLNIPFTSSQQQQKTQLVLSSPTLVDCHY